MPKASEMAATFYRPEKGELPATFSERHRKIGPWKPESVAVLLLDPEAQHLALCLPKKVISRAGDGIRVPVQGRLKTGPKEIAIDPCQAARTILWGKAQVSIRASDVMYLGFGYTRSFRAGEMELPFHKRLHFTAAQVSDRRRLPCSTGYSLAQDWYHIDSVKGMAEFSMDERKAHLFLEALRILSEQHTPYALRLRAALQA